MDQLVACIFIVMIFVCCSKCEGVDYNTSGRQLNATIAAAQSPKPICDILLELQKLNNTKTELMVQKPKRTKRLDEDLILKQLIGFSTIFGFPFYETTRAYFKIAYRTYLLLQPEFKFFQCMIKYFYMRFPQTMQMFQMQNLSKYIRQVYVVSGIMANNMMTRTIFSWFEDTELDRERIAIKTAAMTSETPNPPPQTLAQPIDWFYRSVGLRPQTPLIYGNYQNSVRPPIYVLGAPVRLRRRIKRETEYPSASISDQDNIMLQIQAEIQYKNNMQKEKMENVAKKRLGMIEEKDGSIDLTNGAIEREAEELFNIDTMFWKGLGFDKGSLKKYSLAYCTRDYVSQSFERFIKNVILT